MRNKSELVQVNEKISDITETSSPTNPMQAAIQSGATPTELLQFMELQERWEANEARKAFVSAMAKFRAECPTIVKTEQAHNSMYANIAGMLRQIKSLMAENGLSHSWRTSQEGNNITVTCVVTHSHGHSEQTSLTAAPDTSGSKNAIQAIGSTVKYLERYTLEACLGLTSSEEGDDDGQGAGQQVDRITEDQATALHAMITDNDIDMDAVLSWLKTSLKCDSLSDISVNAHETVVNKINATIKHRKSDAKD